MSRYIDAEALIMALRLEYPMMPMFKENQQEWGIKTEGYRKAEEVIKNAPSIDIDTDVWCEDCKEYDKEHHNCPRFNRVIRTALEDADMVRVVRCKECRHRQNPYAPKWCYEMSKETNADDFCSYGERSE